MITTESCLLLTEFCRWIIKTTIILVVGRWMCTLCLSNRLCIVTLVLILLSRILLLMSSALNKVQISRLHHGDGTCACGQPVHGALRQLRQLQGDPGHQHRAAGHQVITKGGPIT